MVKVAEELTEPQKVLAHFRDSWGAPGISRATGVSEGKVRELLANRRFVDKLLWETVQRSNPEFGHENEKTLRAMLEQAAPGALSGVIEMAHDETIPANTRLKAMTTILDRIAETSKKGEIGHKHDHAVKLPPEMTEALREGLGESRKLLQMGEAEVLT